MVNWKFNKATRIWQSHLLKTFFVDSLGQAVGNKNPHHIKYFCQNAGQVAGLKIK